MGGKSRKSGGVSKKLIAHLKEKLKEDNKKHSRNETTTKTTTNSDKGLFE